METFTLPRGVGITHFMRYRLMDDTIALALIERLDRPLCFTPEDLEEMLREAIEGVKLEVKDPETGETEVHLLMRNNILTAKVEQDILEFTDRMVRYGYFKNRSEVVRFALRILMRILDRE